MPTEATRNAPKSDKKFRAGVYDTEGNLLKIKHAMSEEALQLIIAEYVALGYVVKEGFIHEIDNKLLWVVKGVKSRQWASKGVPVLKAIHYA